MLVGCDGQQSRPIRSGDPSSGSASATPVSASAAPTAGGPRLGVYGCMDQDGNETPTLQFGLVDASTYSTFDGGRGQYSFDGGTAILTFTTGPFGGLKRKLVSKSLVVLDETGAVTALNCPWTPKDPRKLHW
jgi:hypothetical protein